MITINLTAERAARGWSQAELARRAGLNATTVSQIESGRFVPYSGQLAKLVAALGLTTDLADWLMDETGSADTDTKGVQR